MPMLGCLFCKRKQRLFKISMVYHHTGSPIKDYIVDFLGPCEQFLEDDQGICSACVFVLNKLLYLKKCMYLIIASGREEQCNNTPFSKFSYVYKHFLENLQKLSYEECESDADQNVTGLLRPVYSSPYEEEREAEYDREVRNTLRHKRTRTRGRSRRRGHNWTRRKGVTTRSKSRLTTYSEPIRGNSRGHSTVMNFSEYYDSDRSESDDDNDQEVALNFENAREPRNGALPGRRLTVSSTTSYPDDISVVITRYKCISGCTFEFESLKELTDHKIEDHGMLANYVCYECYNTKFASQEDLKQHNDLQHHILISHCFLCSMELRTTEDLQEHLREHKLHSYPCSYCDMFFLDRHSCKTHVAEFHKGKRKRIRRPVRCTIVDRIQRSNEPSPIEQNETGKEYENQILWRLQKRPLVEKLSALCADVIKRFYQGTVDISTLTQSSCGRDSTMDVPGHVLEVQNEILCSGDQTMEVNHEILNIEEDVPNPIIETEIMESTSPEISTFMDDSFEENRSNRPKVILNGNFSFSDTTLNSNRLDAESNGAPEDSGENTNKAVSTSVDQFERFTQNNVRLNSGLGGQSRGGSVRGRNKRPHFVNNRAVNRRTSVSVPVDFRYDTSDSEDS